MTTFLLTCPYCNAQFSYAPPPSAAVRVTCPRCEDTFPWQSPIAAEEHLSVPRTGSRPGAVPRPPASDNERVSAQPLAQPALLVPALGFERPVQRLPTAWIVQLAGLSLAVALGSLTLRVVLPNNTTERALPFMLLLAGVGLVASLWLWFLQTPRSNAVLAGFVLANMASAALLVLPFLLDQTDFRRSHDPQKPPPQAPVTVDSPAVAPGQLAGLGYLLPGDTLVAGIHVAELLHEPVGTKMFGKRQEGEPPPPWLIDQGFGRVQRWTGLKPEQIDHVVFGMRVDGLPHLTIVVRTLQPYDRQTVKAAQDALAASLGTKVVPIKDGDYYKFKDKLGYGSLWLADGKTLILVYRVDALTEKDDLALTEKQRHGGEGPAPALRKVVGEKLAKGTLLWWCAIDVKQPQLAASMLGGAGKDEELARLLENVRSLTGGLRLQKDEAAVLANFECTDAVTGRRLAELLQQRKMPGLEKPVVQGPADGGDNWVLLQLRGQPDAVVRALGGVRLLPGKGKN